MLLIGAVLVLLTQSVVMGWISGAPGTVRATARRHAGAATGRPNFHLPLDRHKRFADPRMMSRSSKDPAMVAEIAHDFARQAVLRRPAKRESHLQAGPVALAWASGLFTLGCQAIFTDKELLAADANFVWTFLCEHPRTDLYEVLINIDPAAQLAFFFGFIYVSMYMFSLAAMPATFPALQSEPDADGKRTALQVPRRSSRDYKQHSLNTIDLSYMGLNSLCMPGLVYHFVCILRSWGMTSDPPLFNIYPSEPMALLTETVPQLIGYVSLYMLTYEFIYYWWHRAMHEVPIMYKFIHKHHHQQTYPDRALVDTLNTGCLESQFGLYLQLAVLWGYGQVGFGCLPAAVWFFSFCGWLSVLEHDKFERSVTFGTPLEFFRADDHHMHHSFVKCNYCPYSTVWDRVFGTFKPFAVKATPTPKAAAAAAVGGEASAAA